MPPPCGIAAPGLAACRPLKLASVQESMETKTEELPDLQLSLSPSSTVAELQQAVSKRCGWEALDRLERCWRPLLAR